MSTPPPTDGAAPAPAAPAHVPAAILPPFGLHGTTSAFDRSQEEWSEYAERLVHYFVANDITGEEKRRAILLNAVGASDNALATPVPTPVHKMVSRKPQLVRQQGSKSECYRCGGSHHHSSCPCKEFVCHFCKKKGHLAKKCRQKNKSRTEHTNTVTEEEIQTGDDAEYTMFQICSGRHTPYKVIITANGKPLSMEIDTGASVSVVGKVMFETFRKGESILELQTTSVRLQTYTGEAIPVLGVAQVPVEHNGQRLTLPLIVTSGSGSPLLGRDWLSALRLDWKTIFSLSKTLTLQQVLDKYPEVFKDGLGELKGMEAKIHIDKDERPRFFKARQVPFALRHLVEEELDRLLSLDVIQPVQFSDWAAPVVPVRKSDGRVRLCGDYKITVNRAAKLDRYPIPRIEELFTSLAGGKAFSKLDLSHAYLQIPLDVESRRYVTINTHRGLFEYKRLPFGGASAPSIFQRVMENLLQGISGVCVYIDDILITGTTESEHLDNLAQVLQRLQSAGMRLKKEKCGFLLPSVSYLGHVISSDGLHTEESKVRAIVDAPEPQNVGELRSFLGMVNYYGKFLPDLATVLSPLYKLLQGSIGWSWGRKQRESFNRVKDLLRSGRVLTHFNDQLPLVLACDASPYGLGAVLSHRMPNGVEKPVGFASRTLSKAERNYSHLDKEALAIIYGVKRYHQYLHGRSFEIKTDHKPLTHILSETSATPTMASGRIQRWALILGSYDYEIQYKEGKAMANADALSRLPLQTTHSEVPQPPELVHLVEYLDSTPLSCTQIRTWTDHDPILSRVRRWVQEGWPAQDRRNQEDLQPYVRRRDELSTEGGCVLWGSRVVMPEKGRKRALELLHVAHPGIVRMKSLARGYMWWPSMNNDIELRVKQCTTCQSSRKMPPVAPLHQWVRSDKPWSRIHIDYAGPLDGKMFLLMIDSHSKWLEVHATTSSTAAVTIELMRKSFASLGLPEVVVSDNAATFTSEEFALFLKRNGIRHVRSPPYHPASNGMVERVVQTFKDSLSRFKSGTLSTKLSRFLLWYRITPHSSTGTSPAEMMWGRRLRSQLDLLRPDSRRSASETEDRQKLVHDAHARPRQFALQDTVYARNYGSGPLWLPGLVVGLRGSAMYDIQLSDKRVIRRHVDQLRSRVRNSGEDAGPSDDMLDDLASGDRSEALPGGSDSGRVDETSSGDSLVVPAESAVTPATDSAESFEQPDNTTEQSTEDSSETVVRRSTRVRQPPVRFGEQCYAVN